MSRTDRLMRLMDRMRRHRGPVTAARLAAETGVSLRQLYRDIATLRAGGALIDGAAGLGYTLTEDPALPPQSFSRLEIEALHLAVQSLGRIGDAELTDAGQAALARIIATLPERQSQQALHAIMHSFANTPERDPPRIDVSRLRAACWDEEAIEIDYTDLAGARTARTIWPLGLSVTERTLMLLAHCRLRMDFRVFHVGQIETMRPTGQFFRPRRAALVREFRALRRAQHGTSPQDDR